MRIKNYKQFDKICEETKLELEVDLEKLLRSFTIEDRSNYSIAQAILRLTEEDNTNNEVEKLSTTVEPKKLLVKIGKQENIQAIGKTVRSILQSIDMPFTDVEIERFYNTLHGKMIAAKSQGNDLPKGRRIQIVTGNEIAKYYDTRNTVQVGGSTELQRSCMNISGKRDMTAIYCKNTAVKLVVILINGKVVARALLWRLWRASNGAEWLLDRVYAHEKADEDTIWEWLQMQDTYRGKTIRKRGTELINHEMVVKLEHVLHFSYPYLDTLSELYIKDEGNKLVDVGFISNVSRQQSPETNSQIYRWIKSQDDYVEFKLRDLKGNRVAVDLRGLDYQNIQKFLIVEGVPEINNYTGEFKKELGLIEAIKNRSSRGEEIISWKWMFDIPVGYKAVLNDSANYKIHSTLETSFVRTWYYDNIVKTLGDGIIPEEIAIPVVEVSKWLNSKRYMILLQKEKYNAIWSSVLFYNEKKWMPVIDAKIFGIWNDLKSQEMSYIKLEKLTSVGSLDALNKFAKNQEALKIRKLLTAAIGDIKDISPFN